MMADARSPNLAAGQGLGRTDGFTLLEVLVALIIFAISFGVIANIFQTSLRQSATADTLFDAAALADHQITRFGTELPLAVGRLSGRSAEGLSWRSNVELAAPLNEDLDMALYRIRVDVRSGDGEQSYITVHTLRVGARP